MDDESACRILLVEDDEDDYILTRSALLGGVQRRFELRRVATPQAALDALTTGEYDAAVVDYRLGAQDGIDLIREAVSRGCAVPCILLTGYGHHDVDVRAMEAGAADYLPKDELTPRVLERTIRHGIERKQAEQEREHLHAQLLQSQKMEAIGRLTAGIAHDFNNMLTAINGFAELLQLKMTPQDPLQAHVKRILESGRSAADLVRQLMAFSRKQMMEMSVVDLNVALSGMASMLRRVIGEDIRLETRLAADLWPVTVDVSQLQQVVLNLAVNGRDAMPEGGRLTVATANRVLDDAIAAQRPEVRPGDYVTLSISDTGCGMSPEVQARIFEPFFTTKELGKGTGLGLSTVYGIVKQSGGYIYVDSQVGVGTTFSIYLPRTQEAVKILAPAGSAEGVTPGTETILLVEDETALREFARAVLVLQGYQVVEASGADEALRTAAARTQPLHLLLTDVVMPGMQGTELARRLRGKHPGLRVLFISGYSDKAVLQSVRPEPGTAFLQKPFSAFDLVRKVRQLLDTPGA